MDKYLKSIDNQNESKKTGGCFRYPPDLPFIEIYLDSSRFRVEKFEIGEYDFNIAVVTRMK